MGGIVRSIALALMVMCAGATAAHAGKVPIPCTGESIVHVLDIPATKGLEIPANKDMETKVLNLGYKFKYCFWGEWVGHLGSDSRYLPLTEHSLTMLLASAGLTEPPSRPTIFSHPSANWVFWMYVVVFGCIAVSIAFKKPTEPATGEATGEALLANIAQSTGSVPPPRPVPQRGAPLRAAAASIPANRMAAASRSAMPAGARQGFGQR